MNGDAKRVFNRLFYDGQPRTMRSSSQVAKPAASRATHLTTEQSYCGRSQFPPHDLTRPPRLKDKGYLASRNDGVTFLIFRAVSDVRQRNHSSRMLKP